MRVSNSKLLCISVQYFSEQSGRVVRHLLQILELDDKIGKAEDLFKSFKDFFIRNEINIQNIIALTCNNAVLQVLW